MNRILHGDVLSFCRHYHGEKFHALLCDPPYSLGFMGKDWDHDIAFQPETWAALAEHLHPGAFGMAFASSRGWHRLAVAIEDAGLRIHPSIFGWSAGSGFPKATRINGNPAFDGHRYGLQALKPALEPIIVFQKPYEGKPVECIVETGAGALNIEQARIPGPNADGHWTHKREIGGNGIYGGGGDDGQDFGNENPAPGRWPANFYLDEEAARRLGEQSGERARCSAAPSNRRAPGGYGGGFGPREHPPRVYETLDSAARFFFQVNRALDEADPVLYCAKAPRKERDAGLAEWPLVPTGEREGRNYGINSPGKKLGGSGKPVNETGYDMPRRNPHPTVKPIDLARWLATLLLPPSKYAPRRILVPFSGSGSEMIGAHLAGWEEIIGIENEAEYVEIARARLRHWTTREKQLALVSEG